MPERLRILDVPVDALSGLEECVTVIEAMIEGEGAACRSIFAVNPEKVMAARKNPALCAALERASLLLPDGIGVVLAARLSRHRTVRRVPGIELMEALCALAAARNWPVFLLGGRANVNERAAQKLTSRYPAVRIVGRRDGYFHDEHDETVLADINASGAQLVFIAMGSPKQELWIDRHLASLRAKVCQGVGGSLDVLAGDVKRAPAVFRRLNLEWFYRLVRQPRRLIRQTALPGFLCVLATREVHRLLTFRMHQGGTSRGGS